MNTWMQRVSWCAHIGEANSQTRWHQRAGSAWVLLHLCSEWQCHKHCIGNQPELMCHQGQEVHVSHAPALYSGLHQGHPWHGDGGQLLRGYRPHSSLTQRRRDSEGWMQQAQHHILQAHHSYVHPLKQPLDVHEILPGCEGSLDQPHQIPNLPWHCSYTLRGAHGGGRDCSPAEVQGC